MSADLSLTIGELSAMVGVSTDTIRAWERRHGSLTPARTGSGHRRYGMGDVDTLRRVRLNVARGLSLKLAVAEANGLSVMDPATPPEQDIADHEPRGTEEAPWRAVADLLPNIVCLLDATGTIIDTNMAFARVAGMLRLKLRATRFLDLVEPADRAKAARIYKPRPTRRRGWELNLRTRSVSGLFNFDTYAVPTLTSAFIVVIGRDLTSSGMDLWPQLPAAVVEDPV